ncbi:hypothetical protein ACFZAM_33465 [Streptomyces sp. NPDC008079]|uniref:hypothetical protein n=1 Tax=Streptomyces sp. NPDC008079 TaxID=3364806 RepID=UPI0036E6E921
MARTCVFCGATPLTKEHVLPRWLKDAFEPSMLPRVRYVTISQKGRRFREAPLLDQQVRVVCATCNNGWMNNLEEGVRRLLPAVIRGEVRVLSLDDQRALVTWWLKTMLMFQHTHPAEDQTAIPAEDYAAFHTDRAPSHLMTARLALMPYLADDSIPIVDTRYQGYGDELGRGWVGTLKIGCAVMQVLRLGPVEDGLRPAPFPNTAKARVVWPPVRPVGWPLRDTLAHPEMDDFARPLNLDWPKVLA